MSLGEVVLLVGGLLTISAIPTVALAEARGTSRVDGTTDLPFVLLCSVLLVTFATLIMLRAPGFGVDSAAYSQLFRSYCAGQSMDAEGDGYTLSMQLLNAAMGGACDTRFLPVAWIAIMSAGFLLIPAALGERIVFLAVLLFSMIGVELTTNALRQGFAIALLVPAVGVFQQRRYVLAAALLALAGALHESALLAGAAVVATIAPWRVFVPGFVLASLAAAVSIRMDLPTGLIGELLYEIQKYQGHESDELWVRIIAAVHVIATVSVTWWHRSRLAPDVVREGQRWWDTVLKLSATGALFIWLPYFGYRYLYATFPVVLWLSLGLIRSHASRRRAQVLTLLGAHAALLLVWSMGSSFMRHVPFLTETALR